VTLAWYQQAGGGGQAAETESMLALVESGYIDLPWPNFYDQMVRVGKGWFVPFIICCIATRNKVAKWVNILQDINSFGEEGNNNDDMKSNRNAPMFNH
jgi:hypothetical protein